jgi:hypothetical protein
MDPNVPERLAVLGFFAIGGCVEAVRNYAATAPTGAEKSLK